MTDFVYPSSDVASEYPYVLEYWVKREDIPNFKSLQIVRVKDTEAGEGLIERWNKNQAGWNYSISSLGFSPHKPENSQLMQLTEMLKGANVEYRSETYSKFTDDVDIVLENGSERTVFSFDPKTGKLRGVVVDSNHYSE